MRNYIKEKWQRFRGKKPEPEAQHQTIKKIIQRAYEAARPSDYFPLIPQSLSPNSATQTGTEKIRDQARYLDENHDLTIGILDTLVSKIVGKEIVIEPLVKKKNGELDTDVNKYIRSQWKEFMKRPEVTRSYNGGKAWRLLCRTWLRDGECLQRFIYGNVAGIEHPAEIPLSFEMIEPDYLPFGLNEARDGQNVIQGVQLHKWGYPVKYHILKQSPYELYPGAGQGFSLDTFPVPAEDIQHLKFTRRIAQVRGVSILHGVIRRMQSIKNYEENEEVASRVASAICGYIKKNPDNADGGADASGNREFSMEPGMIFDNLLAGEEVGMIESDRPNTGLLDFRNALLRAATSGTMSTFSAVSKYYEGSYSAQRQEAVEGRTNYDILRDEFISINVQPTYNRFLQIGYDFLFIPVSPDTDLDTLYDAEINGIPVAWIDPKKEIEAYGIAVDKKFLSRAAVVRMMGVGNPEDMRAEIEQEKSEEPDPVPVVEPEAEEEEPEENE